MSLGRMSSSVGGGKRAWTGGGRRRRKMTNRHWKRDGSLCLTLILFRWIIPQPTPHHTHLIQVPTISKIPLYQGVSSSLLLYSIFRTYLREELFQLTNEQQTNSVVFMTFWQGIALSLLATTTDIIGSDDDDDDQVDKYAKQAQNFLICLEMLGFSIAHFYCFPVEEWEEGYEPEEDRNKYGDKMALGDFLQDLKVILR